MFALHPNQRQRVVVPLVSAFLDVVQVTPPPRVVEPPVSGLGRVEYVFPRLSRVVEPPVSGLGRVEYV